MVDLPAELGEKFELDRFSTSGTKDQVSLYAEKGKPFGIYWTYLPTYVNDANSPYNGKLIVDENGYPVYNDELSATGFDANYDWTGGLSTSLSYKGFSISAALDIRKGGKMFSRTKNLMEFTGNGIITTYNDRNPFVIPNSVMQVKDADGNVVGYTENTVPIYTNNSSYQTYFDEYGAGQGRLFYLVDRSFVKLRNVAITYNFPKKWIGPLSGLSLSAFVNNAFTWTAKDNYYIDPESTNMGTDTDGLMGETYVNPSCRIYSFNLNIKF